MDFIRADEAGLRKINCAETPGRKQDRFWYNRVMTAPKIAAAEFVLSAHRVDQFPPSNLPEVAFLGRSNVGKSSLINALLGRKKLVRTSSRPGCTRAVNFFLVNGCWYFVDLPGFGYAAVSHSLKKSWGRLVLEYLEGRKRLAAVVFLQDGRRRVGSEELFLWEYLTSRGRTVVPVLTKADKLKMGERSRQFKHLAAALAPFGAREEDFTWFSAHTLEGRDRLWARLRQCLNGS
jgi:GTP-binding protein